MRHRLGRANALKVVVVLAKSTKASTSERANL
jgi:hypothetical protein